MAAALHCGCAALDHGGAPGQRVESTPRHTRLIRRLRRARPRPAGEGEQDADRVRVRTIVLFHLPLFVEEQPLVEERGGPFEAAAGREQVLGKDHQPFQLMAGEQHVAPGRSPSRRQRRTVSCMPVRPQLPSIRWLAAARSDIAAK